MGFVKRVYRPVGPTLSALGDSKNNETRRKNHNALGKASK